MATAPTSFRKWPQISTKADGVAPKPGSSAPDPYGGLSGTNRDAAVALTNLFASYGLQTLAPVIINYIKAGYSADTISILLQDTPEYKQRFSANDARRAAGLPVLTPAEYLSTERAYRQLMQDAGLPPGFYDQPSDFTKWIENDVSPTEVQSRVQAATELVNNAPPEMLNYFKQHYTTGDLIAYALDQKRAVPLIERQINAARIGGAGAKQGLNVSQSDAEMLAQAGVSGDQAQQGFGFVKDNLAETQRLGAIYGTDITQQDLTKEVFLSDSAAMQKRRTLASKERAAFGGSGGLSDTSLSKGSAGAL